MSAREGALPPRAVAVRYLLPCRRGQRVGLPGQGAAPTSNPEPTTPWQGGPAAAAGLPACTSHKPKAGRAIRRCQRCPPASHRQRVPQNADLPALPGQAVLAPGLCRGWQLTSRGCPSPSPLAGPAAGRPCAGGQPGTAGVQACPAAASARARCRAGRRHATQASCTRSDLHAPACRPHTALGSTLSALPDCAGSAGTGAAPWQRRRPLQRRGALTRPPRTTTPSWECRPPRRCRRSRRPTTGPFGTATRTSPARTTTRPPSSASS